MAREKLDDSPDNFNISQFKVVLEGYRRCPDSHDLSECHHLTMPTSVNFDTEKVSVETLSQQTIDSPLTAHNAKIT